MKHIKTLSHSAPVSITENNPWPGDHPTFCPTSSSNPLLLQRHHHQLLPGASLHRHRHPPEMRPLELRKHDREQTYIPHHVVPMANLHPRLRFLESPQRLVAMRVSVSREDQPLQLFQRPQALLEELVVNTPVYLRPERKTGAEAEVL